MSETENTMQPQAKTVGPESALESALKLMLESLNTLCAGKLAFEQGSATQGDAEAWPERLTAPLIVSKFEISGDLSGAAFMIAKTSDARTMRALMLGEEPSGEDASPELSEDELDAYRELGNNAASALGASLREALACSASVTVSPSHSTGESEKVLAEIGKNSLLASSIGTIGNEQTVLALAFDAEICRSIGDFEIARTGEKKDAVPKAEHVSESVKRILKLPVPVIVVLAEKEVTFESAINLSEGSVIEFSKSNNEPLGLLVNNHRIGKGRAIKIGENFGLRIDEIGSPQNIVETLL